MGFFSGLETEAILCVDILRNTKEEETLNWSLALIVKKQVTRIGQTRGMFGHFCGLDKVYVLFLFRVVWFLS